MLGIFRLEDSKMSVPRPLKSPKELKELDRARLMELTLRSALCDRLGEVKREAGGLLPGCGPKEIPKCRYREVRIEIMNKRTMNKRAY